MLEDKRFENTVLFIMEALDKGNDWLGIGGYDEMWPWLLSAVDKCYESVIREAIRVIPYDDFLKTPYWKAVSYKCKKNAGFACQLCGSKENLNAHHRSYDCHGEEHRKVGTELTCLCNKCHAKFHGKE